VGPVRQEEVVQKKLLEQPRNVGTIVEAQVNLKDNNSELFSSKYKFRKNKSLKLKFKKSMENAIKVKLVFDKVGVSYSVTIIKSERLANNMESHNKL
jgi:hypothetical protein